ncbi:MAG: hypothetical protein QOI41_72 [Myxococcales bacterium]|jgi:hypothetical protein|nr:hypothetical protein [Myxococcales bacterium]
MPLQAACSLRMREFMHHRFAPALLLLQISGLLVACVADPSADESSPLSSSSDSLSSAVTTRTQLGANNTSGSSQFRDRYTPAARFDGAHIGVVSNGDAPLPSVSATSLNVGAVSKVPTRSLLYPGSTTKLFVETQSWFCTQGLSPLGTTSSTDQCGSHIDIGYASNTTAHVKSEIADMMSRGFDGIIANWVGQGAGKGIIDGASTSSAALVTGTLFATMKAAEATGGKFQFAVMEDEGIKGCAASPSCDITNAVISDLQFIATNFYPSPAYYRIGSRPVLYFFSIDAWAAKYGKKIDWAFVRAHAAGNPLFVFENAGAYGHANSDGAYSWLTTTPIASYPGSDPFATAHFLPYFYSQAVNHPSKITFGAAFKGFDDHVVNGWAGSGNGRRYTGQQCGKTWLDTFREANKHYSASNPLTGMQLITWDDYEEGSELETGIESYVAVTPAVAGSTLSWKIGLASGAAADCASAVSAGLDLGETIHHFAVYASPAGDGENLTLVADDLPATTRSFDFTGKLPAGSWSLYVYAVGQPSIRNHLSAAVAASGSGGGSGGDGCSGNPQILEPTAGQSVGPAIHLRTTAPACIATSIAYVDGKQVATGTGALDVWVPVTMGAHTLNVNGWAGTSTSHPSSPITFTRTY